MGRRHGVWGRRHGVWGRRHGVWGGELSDSGSSGYWSWDHGNVSPAPSPSVAEMDSRPDEGLHMELGGELHTAARSKSSFRGTYRCLWPSCGKVLTSSVGMKRHVRVMHLGGSEQSPREEDFYYTKISCEAPADPSLVSPLPPDPSPVRPLPPDPSPVSPLPPAPLPASSPHVPWASCGSPLSPDPDSGLQITSSGSGSSRPSSGPESAPYQHRPLSQSAPSSSWQIQTDHLYQACTPLQVTMSSCSPAPCCWTPPPLTVSNQHSHHNTQVVTGRCRSVSVGEQWLQQNSATNRLTTLRAASPSGSHCSFRKGRGEAETFLVYHPSRKGRGEAETFLVYHPCRMRRGEAETFLVFRPCRKGRGEAETFLVYHPCRMRRGEAETFLVFRPCRMRRGEAETFLVYHPCRKGRGEAETFLVYHPSRKGRGEAETFLVYHPCRMRRGEAETFLVFRPCRKGRGEAETFLVYHPCRMRRGEAETFLVFRPCRMRRGEAETFLVYHPCRKGRGEAETFLVYHPSRKGRGEAETFLVYHPCRMRRGEAETFLVFRPCRKGRGEAKKCRKVYGVEHKEQWCTACRWKKACQRFTD
ncbi:serine/arginine repetitive matrix protein 2-like isoform X2 [Oncorhynchus nerka]|uniref:serine/arginine repetitive matrix protein 2-like isoform X2 n=1 Tax=Oncorhynchus nerka TaxID=8023 RepID=UPI0031B830F4